MLKIKLFPRGKKHQRTFRIVVAEARSKYNGNIVADLGFYTPQTKTLQFDKDQLAQWQKNGAQLATGVDKLLNPDKYPRRKKTKKETTIKPNLKTEEIKSEQVKPEVSPPVEAVTTEAPKTEEPKSEDTPVQS